MSGFFMSKYKVVSRESDYSNEYKQNTGYGSSVEDRRDISIRERIAEACLAPKDVLLGYALISMIGKREILIENHRGILEYNQDVIRLSTKQGQVRITGKHLNIHEYTNDEMKIEGKVVSIEFI